MLKKELRQKYKALRNQLSEEDLEGIDLVTIGEIAASAFGWL